MEDTLKTKQCFNPGTMIYPLPAVLVGCGASPEDYNLITVAWTGILSSEPPVCYVALRPERHSYGLIKKYGEFSINLTTHKLAKATDWCGVKSGKDFDKFKECGLDALPGIKGKAPVLAQSPLTLECKVRQCLPLGSHHAFVADIVNVLADKKYLDKENGKFDLEKAGLLVYAHGFYFKTGDYIDHFGFSVRKKGTRRK